MSATGRNVPCRDGAIIDLNSVSTVAIFGDEIMPIELIVKVVGPLGKSDFHFSPLTGFTKSQNSSFKLRANKAKKSKNGGA